MSAHEAIVASGAPPALRRRLWAQLEPAAWPRAGLSPLNKALVGLILLATAAGIVETEPAVEARWRGVLIALELCFGLAFLAEYLARLWVAPEGQAGPAWRARLRFVRSPWSILDLVVILATLLPFVGVNPAMLRLVRLARIARLAKIGRMSRAVGHIAKALRMVRDELMVICGLAAVITIFAATLLYWIEGEVQPDKFGSIPRAMWWAVVTMTTIGYGDVFPVTTGGKMAAALLAVVGVGLIALPAGLAAGALSQVMHEARDSDVK